jgi:hypothetical protein
MARSDSQRLEILKTTRDSIDDALAASASDVAVISYTTSDGRMVTRSRIQAQQELDSIEKRIQKLELRESGPAVNLTIFRRRP